MVLQVLPPYPPLPLTHHTTCWIEETTCLSRACKYKFLEKLKHKIIVTWHTALKTISQNFVSK